MRDFGLPVGVHDPNDDVSLDFQLNRLATLGGGGLALGVMLDWLDERMRSATV